MNIKFLTIILSLALVAANAKADEQEDMAAFGLDDEIVEISEEAPEAETPAVTAEKSAEETQNPAAETPAAAEDSAENAEAADAETSAEEKAAEEEIKQGVAEMQQKIEENKAEISYFIQNMNLEPKQLDAAREISEESRLRQMQLLQSIEQLQEQVKSLEAKSLEKFKGVLKPEQQAMFEQLKDVYLRSQETKADLQHVIEAQGRM